MQHGKDSRVKNPNMATPNRGSLLAQGQGGRRSLNPGLAGRGQIEYPAEQFYGPNGADNDGDQDETCSDPTVWGL